MNDFKWCHFRGELILWAVRWYCSYGISMAQWFRDKGFSVSEYWFNQQTLYLNALWETKKIGARPPFAQNLWLLPHLVTRGKDYGVQVRYEDGNPIKVGANYKIL